MTEIHALNFPHDTESTSYPLHRFAIPPRSSGRNGCFRGLAIRVLAGIERRGCMTLGLEGGQASPHILLGLEMVLGSFYGGLCRIQVG